MIVFRVEIVTIGRVSDRDGIVYTGGLCSVVYSLSVSVCSIHGDVGVEIPYGVGVRCRNAWHSITATEGSGQGGIPLAEGPGLKDGSEM